MPNKCCVILLLLLYILHYWYLKKIIVQEILEAVEKGDTTRVEELLDKGADVNESEVITQINENNK